MGDIVCDAKLVAVEAVFMTGALIFVEKRAQIAVRHELKHQTEVGERVPGDTNQLDDVWVIKCCHGSVQFAQPVQYGARAPYPP
jgi:hypothetical protein